MFFVIGIFSIEHRSVVLLYENCAALNIVLEYIFSKYIQINVGFE